MTPPGRVEGNTVLVDPPHAARLYAKHIVGDLRPDGVLVLSFPEAAWCLAGDRIAMERAGSTMQVGELLSYAPDERSTAVAYLAYADLRERGLVVRHDATEPGLLAVWPRGVGIAGEPEYKVRPASERTPLEPTALWDIALRHIVAAVVDEDGAVTHYKVERELPVGTTHVAAIAPGRGRLLADRVLVEDPAFAAALWSGTFAGQRLGPSLTLSLTEAAWLHGLGTLTVDGGNVNETGARLQPKFNAILQVYTVLRAAGVVPKSGFKFGTHLRGYQGDPDTTHAPWLIDCCDDASIPWSALARGIRLAHGVRKKFLVARPNGGITGFVALSWFRP